MSTSSLLNLASACQRLDRWDEVMPILREVLKREPDHPTTAFLLALVHHHQGNHDSAEQFCRRALELEPRQAEVLNLLGELEEARGGEGAKARLFYESALGIKPDLPQALNNLGSICWRSGDVSASIDFYRRMIAADPTLFQGFHNLGRALQSQGEIAGAVDCYERALQCRPDFTESAWNLSICALLLGDYEKGWRTHEQRLQLPGPLRLHAQPDLPRWQGEPLGPDQPLLLVSEQGFGDAIQFIRYATVLRERGLTVRLCLQPQLHSLAIASGLDANPLTPAQVAGWRDGVWLPLLSLPGLLGVSPADSSLERGPYLKPLRAHVRRWRRRLRQEALPVIGIHWQGNPQVELAHEDFRGRSLPLEAFRPLAEGHGVRLLSLQKGYGSEQLQSCSFTDHFVGCQPQVDQTWDFLETAAIIENCDLVITSDSAVAHLAGGLGKPTWLLLKRVPEWRWGLEAETTFWYPNTRLFRQRQDGDWAELFERVALELGRFLQQRPALSARPSAGFGDAGLLRRRWLQARCLGWTQPFWAWVASTAEPGATAATTPAPAAASPSALAPEERAQRTEVIQRLIDRGVLENAEILAGQLVALAGAESVEPALLLARIQLMRGETEAAIRSCLEALRWAPRDGALFARLALCWQRQGRLARAERLYRRALALGCSSGALFCNYGVLLHQRGRLQEAMAMQQQALRLDPDDADAHFNLAACLLSCGAYPEGWLAYEWRFARAGRSVLLADPARPRWDGQASLSGERLLVMAEGGFGDTLHFVRYLPMLEARGIPVLLCAPEPLHHLLQASQLCHEVCGPQALAACGCAEWFPLASLPALLGVTAGDPLVSDPYIRAPAELVAAWGARVAPEASPRIGIAWQGNRATETFVLQGRSLPLDCFGALLDACAPSLLALQKGDGLEQLDTCSFRGAFMAAQAEFTPRLDFAEVAAGIAHCDLVISSDTAVAHLAAAMGRPTWLLLHNTPDWRWGLEGERSFWYPSMRLFRQRQAGDWQELMGRVAAELQRFTPAPPAPPCG